MPDGSAGHYEVLEDRWAGRRTWPTDVKVRIVAESHAPGVMVSEVARRHRLMPSQVTTWLPLQIERASSVRLRLPPRRCSCR